MKNVTQEEWRSLIANDEKAIIIDVRTPQEWGEGVLEDALLINIQDSARFIYEIKKMNLTNNYYMYCRSGGRSQMACQIAESLGVKNTFNLQGGTMMWNGRKITRANNN